MNKIYIRFSSKKERDHMWNFIQSLNWEKIHKTENDSVSNWMLGEKMGFNTRLANVTIGVQSKYTTQWMWAVMAWIGMKSKFKILDWNIVFINDEEIPIFIDNKMLGNDILVVDKNHKLIRWRDGQENGPDMEKQMQFIDEMNAVWKIYKKKKNKTKKEKEQEMEVTIS